MQLVLNRFEEDNTTTIGKLIVPVDPKILKTYFTLEDEYRAEKVLGETRVDAGEYRIRLRREGGMVKRYDKRFAPFHDGMLWLQDVPRFEWVYMHVGNTDDHTDGCILVGMARGAGMTIVRSAVAYTAIYKAVWEYAEADDLSILINDIPLKEAA